MQRVGHCCGQGEPPDLIAHIPGDTVDGGLHFRHHPLGFVDPIEAALRESFVLGHAAHGVNVALDISHNELAVSTHPALYIDQVVGLANAPDALGHLLALPADALELVAGSLRLVWSLLQASGALWGAIGRLWIGLVTRRRQVLLSLLQSHLRRAGRLARGPLFGSQGSADGFDQLMLDMA